MYAVHLVLLTVVTFCNTWSISPPNMGKVISDVSNQATDFVGDVSDGVQNEIGSVKHTVETPVVTALSALCEPLKSFLGYEEKLLKNYDILDYNELRLVYWEGTTSTAYELPTAAEILAHNSQIVRGEKILIFCHGFTDSPYENDGFFKTILKELQNKGKKNIFALDGSQFIDKFYLRSTTYVQVMGKVLGEALANLTRSRVIKPEDIHIIGHSLGAHISGFTGKEYKRLTNNLIGQITGLDPAGPCFQLEDTALLTKNDAQYVLSIHTNGGVLGYKESIGHVDFFPNEGERQPGCLTGSCSHSRAWQYYAEAIRNPEVYVARFCPDWEDFKNRQCDHNLVEKMYNNQIIPYGNYYFQTKSEEPYGKGDEGLAYEADTYLKKGVNKIASTVPLPSI